MELSSTSHIFYFLSGSFRSLSLFLLAFDSARRVIHHVQTVSTLGPHQYLATNQHKDRVFTTTWAQPPSLQSWILQRSTSEPWYLSHLNTVPVTATSSYIDIPPPFSHIYSMGGPTGEVHSVDKNTGGFGQKIQEILFVPESELSQADKTRVALRYGSHGIESTSTPSYSLSFVPVLGTDTIEVYSRNITSGQLNHISSSPSPRGPTAHDGPRHVKIHPNGKVLYCVTEHSNFVDSYEITATDSATGLPFLKYNDSRSLLPSHLASGPLKQFRGDTLMLTPPTHTHPSPYALFTTTRGSTSASRGWLSIFALDEDGYFVTKNENHSAEIEIRYETHSSGGKANAIDLLTRCKIQSSVMTLTRAEDNGDEGDNVTNIDGGGDNKFDAHSYRATYPPLGVNETLSDRKWEEVEEGVWILLTDDDETTAAGSDVASSTGGVKVLEWGGVKVLEWGGWGKEGVSVVAEWPGPPQIVESDGSYEGEGEERMIGGSHAIWLH